MDVITLQAAKAAAKLLVPASVQAVAVGSKYGATLTGSSAGTGRHPFLVNQACTDLRLVYTNWTTPVSTTRVDTLAAANAVIGGCKIAIGANEYRVTFGGNAGVTIAPGGEAISDPIGVEVPAGTIVQVFTYYSSTAWVTSTQSNSFGGIGGFTATTDLSAIGAAAIADGNASTPAPAAIIGIPTGTAPKGLLIHGDSIGQGSGDGIGRPSRNTIATALGGGGYPSRVAVRAGTGLINIANSGDQANWASVSTSTYLRRRGVQYARNMIDQYGINDLNAGARTVAATQVDLIARWVAFAARGLRIFRPTLTPYSSSTDNWTTVGNQTAQAQEANRLTFNQWVRDGCPMLNGAAAATGSNAAGTVRAGQAGHPLFAVFDPCAAVESAQDSGKWIGSTTVRSTTGTTSSTTGTFTVTDTAANFTSADLGRYMLISGGGTAGGVLLTLITQIQSTTSVRTGTDVVANVSNVNMSIVTLYTSDGLHPTSFAAQAIADAFPIASLL